MVLQTDDQNAGNWCPKPPNTGNPSIIFSDRGSLFRYLVMVGASRFERPTPCSQGRCATRLRYAPSATSKAILHRDETKSTPILTMIWRLSRIVEELKWIS